MQIGVVGLGRMGGNIVRRLAAHGHECVVFDRNAAAARALAKDAKATEASGLQDMVGRLKPPRTIWLMLPAGEATDEAVSALSAVLERGDVVIDGGNSF